jgi:hypothetical protein
MWRFFFKTNFDCYNVRCMPILLAQSINSNVSFFSKKNKLYDCDFISHKSNYWSKVYHHEIKYTLYFKMGEVSYTTTR